MNLGISSMPKEPLWSSDEIIVRIWLSTSDDQTVYSNRLWLIQQTSGVFWSTSVCIFLHLSFIPSF